MHDNGRPSQQLNRPNIPRAHTRKSARRNNLRMHPAKGESRERSPRALLFWFHGTQALGAS